MPLGQSRLTITTKLTSKGTPNNVLIKTVTFVTSHHSFMVLELIRNERAFPLTSRKRIEVFTDPIHFVDLEGKYHEGR